MAKSNNIIYHSLIVLNTLFMFEVALNLLWENKDFNLKSSSAIFGNINVLNGKTKGKTSSQFLSFQVKVDIYSVGKIITPVSAFTDLEKELLILRNV